MNLEQTYNDMCNLNLDRDVLYRRGIVDINEHMPTLRKYAESSKHVTEMGTRFAVSTVAFLAGKPEKFVAIDMNYHFFKPYENEILEYVKESGVDFEFRVGDVLNIDIEKTDCLFIDTLHTYNQLYNELKRHESNVNKWIILHDTVTFGYRDEDFYTNGEISKTTRDMSVTKRGLIDALNDFLNENSNWVVKETFENNNGLTILERC